MENIKNEPKKHIILGSNTIFNKTYLLPLIYQKGVFWICVKNDYELAKIYKLIKWWYKIKKLDLPQIITWANNKNLNSTQHYNILNNTKVLIITTPDNILSKVINHEEFNQQIININVKDKLNLSTLKEKLINNGYEVNSQADQPGLLSYRGFIIDIFSPQYSNPFRIELDNDTIKTISEIDNISKKKNKEINSINILPIILNNKHKTCALNITTKANILIDNDNLAEYPEIEEHEIGNIYVLKPIHENGAEIILKNTNYFQHNIPLLKKFVVDKRPTIITQNENRVANLFNKLNIKINILEFKDFTFPGINDEENNNIYITDANIFTIENIAKTKSDEIYQADIKLGDYVVHRDHGIAKFTQTIFQTIDNIEREYFVLQYQGEDRLYLPINQVDKISKYLGVKNPKLHRLGATSTWPQIIRKVKEDIIKMAQQLLNLYARRELSKANPLLPRPEEENKLAASFPYVETEDQTRALDETLNDLTKETPTDRLICGDVGFGKTEIAVRAAYRAILNGQQTILLCPTTILAQQHYDTFTKRFEDYAINISLLSRFVDNKKQSDNIADIKSGKTNIIIGTHRLLSRDIKFNKVGLIIIDEEQQFGVQDKEKLKDLKTEAHIIALSATPIPRTLNLSLSGVRDISIIATAPAGRLPIKTIIGQFSENIIKEAITYEVNRGGQVYYLYNKVETINEQLKFLKSLLPQYTYGIVHGQLTSKKIAKTMHNFDTGKIDILICSTIIANGLDLANVNTLIVTSAQNFGLAQLYQIRGRVGRSNIQAHAYFLYNSQKLKGKSADRLQALQEAEALGSGFQIATRDMEIRGIGNILGKKQHGKVSLIGLTLYNELIKQTISEIQPGLIPTSLVNTTIDLPISHGLPQNYLKSETGRLKYYQLLANCKTIEKLNDHFKRLPKPWPQKIQNLKDISELRILSEQANINLITNKNIRNASNIKTYIYIHFNDELNYSAVKNLLDINPNWEFKDNVLKIDKEKLNKNRLNDLKQVIKLFI